MKKLSLAAVLCLALAAPAYARTASYAPLWRNARPAIEHVANGDHIGSCKRARVWLTCHASFAVTITVDGTQSTGVVHYLIDARWRGRRVVAWPVFTTSPTIPLTR